jgi:hypothetical protein
MLEGNICLVWNLLFDFRSATVEKMITAVR